MDLREKAVCKQSCSCANEETLDEETLNKCFIVSCFLDASKQGKVFLKISVTLFFLSNLAKNLLLQKMLRARKRENVSGNIEILKRFSQHRDGFLQLFTHRHEVYRGGTKLNMYSFQ